MIFPPPLGIHSLPPPYPPLRSRISKPMKFFPKLIGKSTSGSKPAGTFKLPKSLTRRLRAWKIIPPSSNTQGGSRRRRRNYVEKKLFGDDKDYTDEDEDDEDDGYVLVKQTCSTGGCSEIHQAGACGGERRANKTAWEYGSRRMMI